VADVANAMNNFFAGATTDLVLGQPLTSFIEIQRNVVIVPEPVTNKLLISASPSYYGEIMRIIHELDAESPQVVVQVLIAEVDLNDSDEFGVEIGLQSPVLFQRGVIPNGGTIGSGTVSFANATGGLVPPGVTVTSTINPAAQPGFNFNNPSLPLGN